jgi:hypothetical protein
LIFDKSDNVGLSPKDRHDLEMVLLGYALANKDHRATIAKAFASGDDLSPESQSLIAATAREDFATVNKWFFERGAKVESGKTVLDAIIGRFKASTIHRLIVDKVEALVFTAKIGTRERMREAASEIVSLLDESKEN